MTEFIGSLERKAMMYEMLLAIENDFIANFERLLSVDDIPERVIDHSNKSDSDNALLSILQGIDFQAYFEICNANIDKLGITNNARKFINNELKLIIPIRNKVMHPRPLGVLDLHTVKGVFEEIANTIPSFTWENVDCVKKKMVEDPSSLRMPPSNAKKSENIIENIPVTVDFEDTNFVGRKVEIGTIKEKLNKKNVHILSVIGDGGIGKTATVIKVLYDLLDDPKCPYNLILWTSLKTNELNNYEFKEIKNSVSSISEMYTALSSFVGNDDSQDTEEYLIDLAKNFQMLLVLDNLETINTEDIKDFLDRFTEYGKVLITSRIGLGEMEHRYKLMGMSEDDVIEYMNILLELHGFESLLTDAKKKEIAINQLHANPLAIKWFVRCLYNGDGVDEILKNKAELANFCMSNVFEKLSSLAHDILDILFIAKRDITVAELIYYMNKGTEDYKDISYAINELAKCNFIDNTVFSENERLSITVFAKEYLTIIKTDRSKAASLFKDRDIQLQAFLQRQAQANRRQMDRYKMKSFTISNNRKDELVVAFWLDEAIDAFEKDNETEAEEKLDLARRVLPGYFDCYKVAAYMCGKNSIEKAKEEYEIAINNCDSSYYEKLYICFAALLLRLNDYAGSLEKLEIAEKYSEDTNKYLLFEKAKIYGCISEFEKAYAILDGIDKKNLSSKELNVYLTRKADLKKRESEKYGYEVEKRIELLKEAYNILDSCPEPDRGLYQYLCVLLRSLAYMYYNAEAMTLMCRILKKYHKNIRNERGFARYKDVIMKNISEITNLELRSEIWSFFRNTTELIGRLGTNEGVVYVINQDRKYGFIKNKEYLGGVYFRVKPDIDGIRIGNIVRFDKIVELPEGRKMVNEILEYRDMPE